MIGESFNKESNKTKRFDEEADGAIGEGFRSAQTERIRDDQIFFIKSHENS